MAYTVPTDEPGKIIAGFTAQWKKYYSDYLPSDNWTLKYTFKKSGVAPLEISSSADSDYHLVNIAPATTSNYTAGDYTWQSYVENSSSGEKYLLESGLIKIIADFSSLEASDDIRSHAQVVLDAVEAVIEGRATASQQEVSVGDKSIKYMSFTQLIQLRGYYRDEIEIEQYENGSVENNPQSYYAEFRRPD